MLLVVFRWTLPGGEVPILSGFGSDGPPFVFRDLCRCSGRGEGSASRYFFRGCHSVCNDNEVVSRVSKMAKPGSYAPAVAAWRWCGARRWFDRPGGSPCWSSEVARSCPGGVADDGGRVPFDDPRRPCPAEDTDSTP